MKNTILLFLLSVAFISVGRAQDFSFDELSKLRSLKFPEFEAKMHEKGYELDHLEKHEKSSIFRKGNNVVSYSHVRDNGYSYHTHVDVKFETTEKDQYEKLKAAAKSSMQYYKTRLRRAVHQHYMEHVYVNDAITAHFYDISFDDSDAPYYEVEVRSIYAPY